MFMVEVGTAELKVVPVVVPTIILPIVPAGVPVIVLYNILEAGIGWKVLEPDQLLLLVRRVVPSFKEVWIYE